MRGALRGDIIRARFDKEKAAARIDASRSSRPLRHDAAARVELPPSKFGNRVGRIVKKPRGMHVAAARAGSRSQRPALKAFCSLTLKAPKSTPLHLQPRAASGTRGPILTSRHGSRGQTASSSKLNKEQAVCGLQPYDRRGSQRAATRAPQAGPKKRAPVN